ncbi:MAG: carbohydrate porin [Bacteroidetes bacterium]|nr:carbohydrate porin [Bacteroidota bacterium]
MLKIKNIVFVLILLFVVAQKITAQGDNNLNNNYKGLLFDRIDSLKKWSCHFQFTGIMQYHPPFAAKYSGRNSLENITESALSTTATLYLGRKLWKGASLFLNPEIAGGKGFSYAMGLAGATNGETFRVGDPAPAVYVARCFFEQHIAIGKSRKSVHRDDEQNQIAENVPSERITISVGKFSLADFFDDNIYSHDPRTEFMNWSLMDNGAWDYPANTRGYTWGAVIELIKPGYAIRASSVLVPKIANSSVYDMNIGKANGETVEFEKMFNIKGHPGNLHFMGYATFSSAPSYSNAINAMKQGDSSYTSVIDGNRTGFYYGGLKYGGGISYNQEITNNFGVFARVGWNDGHTATWAFTEIDQTLSGGFRYTPTHIKRPDDHFGLAYVVNGISKTHRNYLNDGGYGFMLGDGKLTRYGYEQIAEVFYKCKLTSWLWATLDYQFVLNPGYNMDRGPVNVLSCRAHIEF